MSSRIRRVTKELSDMAADVAKSNVSAEPMDGGTDLTHIEGRITGPPGTPYEGGHYIVDIRIPPEYPFRPPIMRFTTRIWHPNVSSQTGAICLDTLGTAWSPVLTIKSTLLSLQSLLESPEPKDPQDAEVAKMMISDPEGFSKRAHEWAVLHAGAPRNEKFHQVKPRSHVAPREKVDDSRYKGYNKDLINRFVNMGFDIDKVVEAFQYFGIDTYGGEDVELEPEYMGDITARLLGEP
ncbi:putative ubiquitin carrier protein [Nemania sp. FL0916]|nr:putative ubiquitin carrier protein [Nemania sp. FL0916]